MNTPAPVSDALQFGALGVLALVLVSGMGMVHFALRAFVREVSRIREVLEETNTTLALVLAHVERIAFEVERSSVSSGNTPAEVPHPTPRPFKRGEPLESMAVPRTDGAAWPPKRRKLPSRRDDDT